MKLSDWVDISEMWKGGSHYLNVNIAGNILEKNENMGRRNCSKDILYIKVTKFKRTGSRKYGLVFRLINHREAY